MAHGVEVYKRILWLLYRLKHRRRRCWLWRNNNVRKLAMVKGRQSEPQRNRDQEGRTMERGIKTLRKRENCHQVFSMKLGEEDSTSSRIRIPICSSPPHKPKIPRLATHLQQPFTRPIVASTRQPCTTQHPNPHAHVTDPEPVLDPNCGPRTLQLPSLTHVLFLVVGSLDSAQIWLIRLGLTFWTLFFTYWTLP